MKLFIINLLLLALLLPISSVNAQENGSNKVFVCHKASDSIQTIEVSTSALDAHLAHGDTTGACQTPGVPEFGLIPGAIALLSSGGTYLLLKKHSLKN